MGYHAEKAPSSAHRWTDCTASIKASRGKPNESREASRRGTCGHQMAAEILLGHAPDADAYLGRVMGFPPNNGNEDWVDKFPSSAVFEFTHCVEQELVDAVNTSVEFVRKLKASLPADAEMFIEVRVPIDHITGEKDASGSSDVILVVPSLKLIICADFKFGVVPVYAYDVIEPESHDPISGETTPAKRRINLQAGMYVLGSMQWLGGLYEFERIKAIIVQPALGKVSEYETDLEEMRTLSVFLSEKARECDENPTFKPSSDNCFFCRARFDCHARNAAMLASAVEGFDDVEGFAQAKPLPVFLPSLGQLYSKLDAIESWARDIREETRRQLLAGNVLMGTDGVPMKLVEGPKPAPSWLNDNEAAEVMSGFRLKDVMWARRLITPLEAERLAEKERKKKGATDAAERKPIGITQWKKLSALVTQGRGEPVPALGTDPRPALIQSSTSASDDYDLFN